MQRPRAIDLTPGNLVTQRKITDKNWSNFLSNPLNSNLMVRDIIHDSWQRCLSNSINPSRVKTEILLKNDEIKEVIQLSYLYEHALPVLQELSGHVKDTDYLVTLADNNGKILFVDGNHKVLQNAEQMNFVCGADWSEKVIGTNAIGTSLAVGRSVQVFAAEHFCECVHNWVCASTPIHDPLSHEILGVVDVTGLWRHAQSHSLGMTVMTAQTIQNNLFKQYKEFHYHLLDEFVSSIHHYPGDGVIVVDEAFHIVEANRYARQTVLERTGKDLLEVWTEQEFHNLLLKSRHPVEQWDTYDIMMNRICMKASIREIQHSRRRIGFILIVRPTQEKVGGRNSPSNGHWSSLIGKSDAICSVVKKCDIAAQTDVPILLQGESGTGKERFARSIHNTSLRRNKPFVAINCGAVPKDLMASELFGFEGGTFTGAAKDGRKGKFEEANGGTVFLDEIEEMPAQFQVYLLRVLQEKEIARLGTAKPIPVDIRIIAATNQNVEELIEHGLFRADLYYRISVVNVTLPSLRNRREDIPLFIQHVLDKMATTSHIEPPAVDSRVLRFLTDIYTWPGNVRELENAFTHAMLFHQNSIITLEDLPLCIKNDYENCDNNYQKIAQSTQNIEPCCEECYERNADEREKFRQLLQNSHGNLSEVSRQLGVARTTVYRRLKKLGLL